MEKQDEICYNSRRSGLVKTFGSRQPFFQHPAKLRDLGLKLYSVPAGRLGGSGGFDTGDDKVSGQSQGVAKGQASHDAAENRGGIEVAGSVVALGAVAGKIGEAFSAAVKIGNAKLSRLVGNAGDDCGFAAQLQKLMEKAVDISLVIFGPVFGSGEQAGFGDVRQDDVRLGADFRHLSGEGVVEGRIQFSVVRHGRIHKSQVSRIGELLEKVYDLLALFAGSKVAGINPVESNILGRPCFRDGIDLVGQIFAGKGFKHGMV